MLYAGGSFVVILTYPEQHDIIRVSVYGQWRADRSVSGTYERECSFERGGFDLISVTLGKALTDVYQERVRT